jgi:bifunctional DNA-binding transcriptional regulator/antitoxin component of YhaV-PrlF toxin-antitoxin module
MEQKMANGVMDQAGRVWIPDELIRALGLHGPVEMQIEVNREDGTLVLHPAGAVEPDDVPNYRPEERARLKLAREKAAKDPGRPFTDAEVRWLAGDDE